MTKYLVHNVDVMPWDLFCICSSESDAQEMVLALTEEILYNSWYLYTQNKYDDEPDFWENLREYKKRCFMDKTLFYLAIYCETPDGWDYTEIEEI